MYFRKRPNLVISIALFFAFFLIGILTLTDYGINWDTINHLPRGQAYLHYFLTGNKDYKDLNEPLPIDTYRYYQNPKDLFLDKGPSGVYSSRSIYQLPSYDFNYFDENDGNGHPPLSDILASVFNVVLFQRLHLINDIDSYRIYSVFLATILVSVIFLWSKKVFGLLGGVISTLVLATYPLFFSELHFNNEKDIPETVFLTLFFYFVYNGIESKKIKWVILSGFFFGLALGTKLNIIFALAILPLWIITNIFFVKQFRQLFFSKQIFKYILAGLVSLLTGVLILLATWPYLWTKTIERLDGVLFFYKQIGTSSGFDSRFVGPIGVNLYPIKAFLYTTQPITLVLFFAALLIILYYKRFKNSAVNLAIIWFVVTFARVTWPGSNIYGGMRQIMEYIPALALICGAVSIPIYDQIKTFSKKQKPIFKLRLKILALLLVLIIFIPNVATLIKIHPNENVYFNFLIGGLSGAKAKDFPFWGNSFGAAYRQGVVWLNENAEPNSKAAYARELLANVPQTWLRKDLELHNGLRSGYLKKGEYVIALTYQGTENTSYFDRYLENNLIPVYTAEVDNTAILKIWKNDLLHTVDKFKKEKAIDNFQIDTKNGLIKINLNDKVSMARIEYSYNGDSCAPLKSGTVKISSDNLNWFQLPGAMPNEDWSVPKIGVQPSIDKVIIPFIGEEIKFIEISTQPEDACINNSFNLKIYGY